MAKEENKRRSAFTVSAELKLVRKELEHILDQFRDKDGKINPNAELKGDFAVLGKPVIQQKKLIEYIYEKQGKAFAKSKTSKTALRAKVQRILSHLRIREPKIQQIVNFKQHQKKTGSPNPSRDSHGNAIVMLQKRLKKLEDFQRRIESMLQSGRPEPAAPIKKKAKPVAPIKKKAKPVVRIKKKAKPVALKKKKAGLKGRTHGKKKSS